MSSPTNRRSYLVRQASEPAETADHGGAIQVERLGNLRLRHPTVKFSLKQTPDLRRLQRSLVAPSTDTGEEKGTLIWSPGRRRHN
jgi:hypothetical protein